MEVLSSCDWPTSAQVETIRSLCRGSPSAFSVSLCAIARVDVVGPSIPDVCVARGTIHRVRQGAYLKLQPLAAAINAVPGAAERSTPQHVPFDHFNGWKGSEPQRRWPDF
jgi:hypothetical protein